MDSQSVDQKNLRRILVFLEEYDYLNANWENAEAFLEHLKQTLHVSFKTINRPYLQLIYNSFRDQKES